MLDEELGEVRTPGVVPKLSRTPGREQFHCARTPGADNEHIFGEVLGLDRDQIDELAERGVI